MAYSGTMGLFAATFLFLFMFAATKTQNRNFQQVSENFCLNIFVKIYKFDEKLFKSDICQP